MSNSLATRLSDQERDYQTMRGNPPQMSSKEEHDQMVREAAEFAEEELVKEQK